MPRPEFKPALQYSLADVRRWCVPSEIAKAQRYLEVVDDLVIEPLRLLARVQGTAASPYEVRVEFHRDIAHHWVPDMRCSCPVEIGCKHATAVLLAALRAREEPDRLNPQVRQWAERARAQARTEAARPASRDSLFYILEWREARRALGVRMLKGREDADGAPGPRAEPWYAIERALLQPPAFVDDVDLMALRLLWVQRGRNASAWDIDITALAPAATLQGLIATGRAFAIRDATDYLQLGIGPARSARLDWRVDRDGRVRATCVAGDRPLRVLPSEPAWYFDAEEGLAGPLQTTLPARALAEVLALPPLGPKDAAVVAQTMQDVMPALPAPPVDARARLRVMSGPPVPVLRVQTVPVWGMQRFRDYPQRYDMHALDVARALFRYDEVIVEPETAKELVNLPGGETVRVQRDPAAEQAHLAELAGFGFERLPARSVQYRHAEPPGQLYALASEDAWQAFFPHVAARVRAAGWALDMPPDFRHLVLEVDAWDAEVIEDEPGWFALDMGITVDGKRVPLAPLLAELLKRDARWLDVARLARIDDEEPIPLPLPEGGQVRVQAGRLKPITRTLIDLFDRIGGVHAMRMPALDAQRLAVFTDDARWRFKGPRALLVLAERLREAGRVQAVAAPAGLGLSLRPYQLDGLAWLQHLRQHALGGILADDMGLGKTAQTLAHLLVEKQAGRLDAPALVVMPTSLVFNWQREAAQIAPALRVLKLHGVDRGAQFARIPDHDVLLTTYPLLWRDEAELLRHEYSFVILDEAQNVKNATSKAALSVRRLRARHRLCLTGTPLENHLGELWAQFDFLLPGFLGDSKDFTRRWRTPIEKHGDTLRRELLARRLKPFILRRRKEDVARELPPKTEMLRAVELVGGQRDLYETVRSAMDDKVRSEIAARGFKRSQIVILDALLKLRQVCCDPRLLSLPVAHGVKERAKIEHLMDMLPALVEEDRRILVFSQFTSMLKLIADALDELGIPFVTLTGDTRDRETPIRSFQEGRMPVFLISLKAGGVGLNLTAADTVIHVDPWWNPAVEEQATDRAHRIGQDKAVFVYKLIAAGSIEERIVALQARKSALAAAVLEGDLEGEVKFDEEDLASLFAPLPEIELPEAKRERAASAT